jgi:hypothetical protein
MGGASGSNPTISSPAARIRCFNVFFSSVAGLGGSPPSPGSPPESLQETMLTLIKVARENATIELNSLDIMNVFTGYNIY